MKVSGLKFYEDKILEQRGERLKLKREKSLSMAGKIIKDLKLNRNWSWYKELKFRNVKNLDKVALYYRGYTYTYREMFQKMDEYANALNQYGIKKGDEIPICMSNTPEFIFLLGAISKKGAIAHIFGGDFDKDYIVEQINKCNTDILFIEDNDLLKNEEIINRLKSKKIVVSSLSNTFKDGYDPYEEMDKQYGDLFKDKFDEIKKNHDNVERINSFVSNNQDERFDKEEDITLESEFTVTYSSGTTSDRPKALRHAVKSYNCVSRFHDPDVNHTPSFKIFSMQATIPTYSSTGLISGISDALTQGCRLALEPIYDPNFCVDSLIINRPSYLDLTRSFWIKFSKDILFNPKYKDVKLPELTICFSVGEPTEINEEKLVNRALRKVGAGKKLIPLPFAITRLSIAGGDCEHGGLFFRLFRSFANMNPIHKIKKEPAGMKTLAAVDIKVMDENGKGCPPYKMGRLVANSLFDMIGYKDNEEANKRFKVKDAEGKEYGDCSVDAYQDFFGGFHLKGRKEYNSPSYKISDIILEDRNRVLSCEVCKEDDYCIAHIEFQPHITNYNDCLVSIEKRLKKKLGEEETSKILYRIHGTNESFELTHSGKRNHRALRAERIEDGRCVKPVQNEDSYIVETASKYFESKEKGKRQILKR